MNLSLELDFDIEVEVETKAQLVFAAFLFTTLIVTAAGETS